MSNRGEKTDCDEFLTVDQMKIYFLNVWRYIEENMNFNMTLSTCIVIPFSVWLNYVNQHEEVSVWRMKNCEIFYLTVAILSRWRNFFCADSFPGRKREKSYWENFRWFFRRFPRIDFGSNRVLIELCFSKGKEERKLICLVNERFFSFLSDFSLQKLRLRAKRQTRWTYSLEEGKRKILICLTVALKKKPERLIRLRFWLIVNIRQISWVPRPPPSRFSASDLKETFFLSTQKEEKKSFRFYEIGDKIIGR